MWQMGGVAAEVSGHTRTIELGKSRWFDLNNLPDRDQRDGCRARCSPEAHKERWEHILPYLAGRHRRWACRTWPDPRKSRLRHARKYPQHRRGAVARSDNPPRPRRESLNASALQPELEESLYSSATSRQSARHLSGHIPDRLAPRTELAATSRFVAQMVRGYRSTRRYAPAVDQGSNLQTGRHSWDHPY